MARVGPKKRKEPEQDEDHRSAFAEAVRLEMLSDEEKREANEGEDEESDEEVDEFPEIDAESDENEEDDEEDEDEDEENSSSGSDSDSGSDMRIFPKSKNIVSQITGHPKRVYPEIEPEYDSDSSVEDVRVPFPMTLGDPLTCNAYLGPKSCREHSVTLV